MTWYVVVFELWFEVTVSGCVLLSLAWLATALLRQPARQVRVLQLALVGLLALPLLALLPGLPRLNVLPTLAQHTPTTPPSNELPAELPLKVPNDPADESALPNALIDEPSPPPSPIPPIEESPPPALDPPTPAAPEPITSEPEPRAPVPSEPAPPVEEVPPPAIPPAVQETTPPAPDELPPAESTPVPEPPRAQTPLAPAPPTPNPQPLTPSPTDLRLWIPAAYLTGVASMLLWSALGVLAVWRLVRRSQPADQRVREQLRGLAGPAGDRVRLLISNRAAQPCAFFWRRPTIVLPDFLLAAGREAELRFALAHEWSHVARGDIGTWLLAGLVRIVHFHQPLVWLLRERLRLCQDYLADAAAAGTGTAEDYAEFLTLASRRVRPRLTPGLGIAGRRSDLHRRVVMLVDSTNPLERVTSKRFNLLAALAALCIVAVVARAGVQESNEGEKASPDVATDRAERSDINPSPAVLHPALLPERIAEAGQRHAAIQQALRDDPLIRRLREILQEHLDQENTAGTALDPTREERKETEEHLDSRERTVAHVTQAALEFADDPQIDELARQRSKLLNRYANAGEADTQNAIVQCEGKLLRRAAELRGKAGRGKEANDTLSAANGVSFMVDQDGIVYREAPDPATGQRRRQALGQIHARFADAPNSQQGMTSQAHASRLAEAVRSDPVAAASGDAYVDAERIAEAVAGSMPRLRPKSHAEQRVQARQARVREVMAKALWFEDDPMMAEFLDRRRSLLHQFAAEDNAAQRAVLLLQISHVEQTMEWRSGELEKHILAALTEREQAQATEASDDQPLKDAAKNAGSASPASSAQQAALQQAIESDPTTQKLKRQLSLYQTAWACADNPGELARLTVELNRSRDRLEQKIKERGSTLSLMLQQGGQSDRPVVEQQIAQDPLLEQLNHEQSIRENLLVLLQAPPGNAYASSDRRIAEALMKQMRRIESQLEFREAELRLTTLPLQPGDRLRVQIIGALPGVTPSIDAAVEADGSLRLSGLLGKPGPLTIAGKTLDEAEAVIQQRIAEAFPNDQAFVLVRPALPEMPVQLDPKSTTPRAHDSPPFTGTIRPGDVLNIQIQGGIPGIEKPAGVVEPDGNVAIGVAYGDASRVNVGGKSLIEAGQAIEQQLKKVVKDPHVQVTYQRHDPSIAAPGQAPAVRSPQPSTSATSRRARFTGTIRPGDVVRVELSGGLPGAEMPELTVMPDGSLPLHIAYGPRRIQVGGKTLAEAEQAIDQALKAVVKDPHSQVTYVRHNPDIAAAPAEAAPDAEPTILQPLDTVELILPLKPHVHKFFSNGKLIDAFTSDMPLLSGTYVIEPDGSIPLPQGLGRVKIGGLSEDRAGEAVREHLAEMSFTRTALPTTRILKRGRAVFPDDRQPAADYQIRPGAKLLITQTAMSQAFDKPVTDEGTLEGSKDDWHDWPDVKVEGLTLSEAQQALRKAWKGKFKGMTGNGLVDESVEYGWTVTLGGWREEADPAVIDRIEHRDAADLQRLQRELEEMKAMIRQLQE
ncbi:MAG: hypothetical protein DWQ37_02660 [Planctomycetota bacterium]|nr:MAG: hypothetical protein DWQ37_02660 [Planctomycetota bacterium]